MAEPPAANESAPELKVRRMHRRDINRAWEFLKRVFRDVHAQTVEYQRPRSKARFEEQYDEEGVEQLLFEVGGDIVGYAECSFEVLGDDNWINPRYFDNRDMRPMFIEELATHPDYQGRGVGSFMIEQLMHLARVRGCTHLVLEVAENNEGALSFYRKRSFYKLDASIFLAKKIPVEPELLPPRRLPQRRRRGEEDGATKRDRRAAKKASSASTSKGSATPTRSTSARERAARAAGALTDGSPASNERAASKPSGAASSRARPKKTPNEGTSKKKKRVARGKSQDTSGGGA